MEYLLFGACYLLVGIVVSCVFVYFATYEGNDFDSFSYGISLLVWPILFAFGLVVVFIYALGALVYFPAARISSYAKRRKYDAYYAKHYGQDVD